MAVLITTIYGIGFIVFLILLIYVIVKRIEEKNEETFEKRDN